ncbi:uncharacterized protein EV154DRAFT_14627 [Mucor mucedo]|uniref:uncharacterized protein n=1 Tax=Mucor mucedo TaxID=29922 RepID=UPI0022203966|nr:uncharacterized protein EV154DRAFT_14627 [Mucor mucedo]KAI7887264.1 hypothetical protein EV154DRAFT_14627 [Mucor mucedo]
MFIVYILQFLLFIHAARSALLTPNQQSKIANQSSIASTDNQKPVYKIGIIFPNATAVKKDDANLANMILSSEVAIQLAADNIKSNILTDVELKFTRYYSDQSSPGKTSWTAVSMIEDGVE